jgi:hypothetical protein
VVVAEPSSCEQMSESSSTKCDQLTISSQSLSAQVLWPPEVADLVPAPEGLEDFAERSEAAHEDTLRA